MNHVFTKQSVIAVIVAVAALATPAVALAYGGAFFVGAAVVTSTPTPTVTPVETPVILGASTTLPETGLSLTDALTLAGCGSLFLAGVSMSASSVNGRVLRRTLVRS